MSRGPSGKGVPFICHKCGKPLTMGQLYDKKLYCFKCFMEVKVDAEGAKRNTRIKKLTVQI